MGRGSGEGGWGGGMGRGEWRGGEGGFPYPFFLHMFCETICRLIKFWILRTSLNSSPSPHRNSVSEHWRWTSMHADGLPRSSSAPQQSPLL